jgi:hypothetical protein
VWQNIHASMLYMFSSILGVFIGAGWDIHHNHGYWITVVARTTLNVIKAVGLV